METTALSACQERDASDAPNLFTIKGVKEWLISRGACAVISLRCVAAIVGCSTRVIKNAERAGELPSVDRCTYLRDDVAEWLLKHPRYIAQEQQPKWELNDETIGLIKALLQSKFAGLIRCWDGGGLDDLVNEIVFRLTKKRRRSSVAISTVIYSVCTETYRDLKRRMERNGQTISLNNLEDEI